MKIADRAARIEPSATVAITDLALQLRAAGRSIISLSAGEPDFETPEHIKAAAREAIERGLTRYTPVDGTADLKAAIVNKFKRDNDLRFTEDQIVVSNGGKHALFNTMAALINPGDEVIIPAPYWVTYPGMTRLLDGVPVVVNGHEDDHFRLDGTALEAALTPRSRILILNSPNNPTGAVYGRERLSEIANVLRRHPQVFVISDDIYEPIHFRPEPFCTLLNCAPDLAERTVIINGVSKAYAMTGWRIGYLAGPLSVAAAARKLQGQTTSNACSISQAAATAALTGDQSCLAVMREHYRARRDYVCEALGAIPGVHCNLPDGAFYAFAGIVNSGSPGTQDDVQLARRLLDEVGLATVPGTAFGQPGYLRLSFAASLEHLREAMDRLQTGLQQAA